jgi:hypothetical protein
MVSPPHRRLNSVGHAFLWIAALAVMLGCFSTEDLGPLGEWAQTEEALNEANWALHLTSTAIASLEAEVHAAQTEESAPISREDATGTAQAEAAQGIAPAPQVIEAPAAAPPAAEAPAPALQPILPAAGSSPPVITRVDFPKTIPASGNKFVGWTSFKDPDGDVVLQRMEVVSSLSMKGFEDDPRQGLFGSPTEGRYDFKIWCFRKQEVTMRVTLVDAAGNQSNSMEFSFECY